MWLALLLILLVDAPTARAQGFENSYAVVVGVDTYQGFGLETLSNAESDARAVERYFRAHGYQVTPLVGPGNATKHRVADAVRRIAAQITERDRFVFFFAGHGKAKHQEGVDIAYLIVPGGRDADDPESLISTGDVVAYSLALDRARHQLFIFDSCYAGLMGRFQTRTGGRLPRYDSETFLVDDLGARRARQYLSAGGEDQKVLDSGLAKLSWFTYFLLKGLEPGVVTHRPSGLITFSELASYVQTRGANPEHTPASGSLAGHGGGEFLLYSTAQGSPRLPPLPDITEQTLQEVGFLTRSEARERVGAEIDRMREPVDLLFQAWTERDVELYLRQFDRSVVQTGRLKGGGTFQRGYDEIAAKRRAFFPRLERVEVTRYELMYQGSDGSQATFGVRYSMDFHLHDGKPIEERNLSECYQVRKHPSEDRWVIVRNDDYQRRICEAPALP